MKLFPSLVALIALTQHSTPDPQLSSWHTSNSGKSALVAFLKTLTEETKPAPQ